MVLQFLAGAEVARRLIGEPHREDSARCGEHSTDGGVLETIPYIETLTTELSNKIWQKISLLPRT